jgi:hypothetical protein
MIWYLRDSNETNIASCEVTLRLGEIDVRTDIGIVPYSLLLLNKILNAAQVIDCFRQIEDIRRWYFEIHRHRADKKDRPAEEYLLLVEHVRGLFHNVAIILKLRVVEG